jgi:hypothetical protein
MGLTPARRSWRLDAAFLAEDLGPEGKAEPEAQL